MTLSGQTLPNSNRMEDPSTHDSWKNWFQLYGPKLLLCARQWTRSLADAEDVVQEAFVRYWKHQRQLPGEPMALLITSVRRAALDHGRRESRRTAREEWTRDAADAHAFAFRSSVEREERRLAIDAALQRIPAAQREVLVLKVWGELTFDQIGALLDISLNTAASRYRYALAALRQELTAADCHG
jgi:RNA polymerase sigma-70 factor (ECF subfamily)